MMQQVNLLTDELKPRLEPLTARQLLIGWGVLAGLLLLVSAWQGLGVWQMAGERAERQSYWQTLTAANARLEAQVRTAPEPELVTEVETLRREFRTRSRMVDAVRGYEEVGATGFSGYLADLAAQHVDGLALDRIELSAGGSHILLSGETEAPIHVPRFLRRLSDGGSFRGHRFDKFRLEAQDSGLLRFDIVGPAAEGRG